MGSNIGRTGQPEPGYDRIIVGDYPAVFKTEYVRNVLSKLCVRATERAVTPRMNALIRVYQLNAYGGESNRAEGPSTRS